MSLLDRVTMLLLAATFGCIAYYAWVHHDPGESGVQQMRLSILRWLAPPLALLLLAVSLSSSSPDQAPSSDPPIVLAALFFVGSVTLVIVDRWKATRPKPPWRDGDPLPWRRRGRQ